MNNEWIARALCANRDPDLFFPQEERMPLDLKSKPPGEVLRAKQVCFRCPVRKECWDDGMRKVNFYEVRDEKVFTKLGHDYTGVRAGMTGKERRALIGAFGENAFRYSEERLGIQINAWGIRRKEGDAA